MLFPKKKDFEKCRWNLKIRHFTYSFFVIAGKIMVGIANGSA